MIVVDNALVAGLGFPGDAYHGEARRIRKLEPQWHAPWLFQSELRSVAVGYLRKGEPLPNVLAGVTLADDATVGHDVTHQEVLQVTAESPLSAYDAEYVALARRLGCKLLTSDAAILKSYPDLAIRLQDFV